MEDDGRVQLSKTWGGRALSFLADVGALKGRPGPEGKNNTRGFTAYLLVRLQVLERFSILSNELASRASLYTT